MGEKALKASWIPETMGGGWDMAEGQGQGIKDGKKAKYTGNK